HCKNGPHWIVPGCVTGGEKKKSEKARVRKGVNILVATPGRLLDHLENTESLDCSRLRWMVLDEGDRLMELGFEETLQKILDIIKRRSKVDSDPIPSLPTRRVTILCSATMKTNVQKLGDISLTDASYIKAESSSTEEPNTTGGDPIPTSGETSIDKFVAPAQLKQTYIVVPP